MKNRFIKLLISCLTIIFSVFITHRVNADEMTNILEIKYYSGHPNTGILYSDGRLLLWGNYGLNTTLENIKSFELLYGGHTAYLTNDNKFFDKNNLHENIVAYAFSGEGINGAVAYKDINNNLYVRDIGSNYSSTYTNNEERIIATDVKDFILVDHWDNSTLLYTTNDDALHVIGTNYFGTKINEGNDFTSVYDLLENIKTFTDSYAISNDGKMYFFNKQLIKPTVYYENVNKVITISDNYRDSNIKEKIYYIEKTDGSYKIFITNNNFDTGKILSTNEISINFKPKSAYYNYILGENNKLYKINEERTNYEQVDSNIRQIYPSVNDGYSVSTPTFYVLTTSNKLIYYVTQESGCEGNSFAKALLHNNIFYGKNELLNNVKSIEYIKYNIILLNDGSVLRYGNNTHNEFNNPELPSSYIPVKINDLNNNNNEINSLEVVLGDAGIKDISVGDEVDYFSTVIPYNSSDRETLWTSSNEEVVTVDKYGLIKGISVGSANICTTLKSNNNIKDCVTVNVYPATNGINITNGEEIIVDIYETVLLTANVEPEDALSKKVIWSVSDNNSTYLNVKNDNQASIYLYSYGSYTVTATTEDGKFSDTITIKTSDRVDNILLDLDSDNYDGEDNLYMFLDDSNELELFYTIHPSSAVNKELSWSINNTSVATISENGIITALKTGSCKIYVSSLDGGMYKTYNLTVYNNKSEKAIPGDMNGDGKITLVDVIILLKKYLGIE